MQIEIDLATVPPTVRLVEPTDFGSFKVVVVDAEHAWVAPERIAELAGDLGDSPEWRADLERMLAFAQSRGWVRDDGAVRAHVEHRAPES